MIVHEKGLDTKEKLKLAFYSYQNIFFSKEFLAWSQGQGHRLISQKKLWQYQNSHLHLHQKEEISALLAIHSPTFMNEIRTACLFLGHQYPQQLFQIKQVRLGNAQMIFMPALKWIQQVPYIQQEYFCNHYKDQRDFSQSQYLWYLLLELIPCMEYNWELHVPETMLVYLLSSTLNISVSPKHR